MLDPFDQKKESILKEIASTNGGNKDLSPKGSIDERCIPIMNLINSHNDMVTTSSCSGRVSVFIEGIKEKEKIGSKGNEGRWIYVNHDPNIEDWFMKEKFEYEMDQFPVSELTRYILYKFEPLILHVKCRDTLMANELYKTAMNCGFRESGIGNNNIVAIRISIKLDVPIGYYENETPILTVNKNYLKFLTKLSLDRFTENFKKLDQLYREVEALTHRDLKASKAPKETKEERRQRKIQEGMAKQEEVRILKQQKKLEKLTIAKEE